MELHDHVPLREHCWFKTGGTADYYSHCRNLEALHHAITQAKQLGLPHRILGEGSSVLVSDSGFPGVVIQNATDSIIFLHEWSQVMVDSGTPLRQLLARAMSSGYSGLEFLTNISGTVGGAVYNNKTYFGYEVSQYVRSATLLFPETGETKRVERDWFEFLPHSSKLKRMRQHDPEATIPIILSVTFQFSKMNHASCLQKLQHFHTLQREFPLPTLPYLHVFDSLCLHEPDPQKLSRRKSLTNHPSYTLDKAAIKTMRSNDIAVFNDNPNFLVNTKVGLSRDAVQVMMLLQKAIREKYDVTPDYLIEYVGYWEDIDTL